MTGNKYTKERKSLCEESMLVLFNILRFSSLSLVVPNLPSDTAPPDNKKVHTEKPISTAAGGARPASTSDDNSSLDVGASWGNGRSKRAQKPEQGGSNVSYLMLPATGGRDNQQHEVAVGAGKGRAAPCRPKYLREDRDETFSDYIKRFHAKNRKDSKNDSTRRSTDALPPPPHSYHDHH